MATLEDALDECLIRLDNGQGTLAECLASYPEYADELYRLLMIARQVEAGRNIRPSAAFRARGRVQVTAYANAHPPRRIAGWWDKILSLGSAFNRIIEFAFGAVAILLLCLLTSTILAQKALPGNTLYGWKLASEQALRMLHPDPLSVDLLLVERRMADLTQAAGRPKAQKLAMQSYEQSLAELSRYTDPQAKQRLSATLLAQKAALEKADLNVPALDQLLSTVGLGQTYLQLDYTAEVVKAGHITYRVTITNGGPTTPVTATLVHTVSPTETLVSTGEATCTPAGENQMTCEVSNLLTAVPQNYSLTTAVTPCFSGVVTSTAVVTGTNNVVNINQNNRIVVGTPIVASYPGYNQVAYVQSNGRGHDLGLATAGNTHLLHLRAAAPAWSPDGSQIAFFGEEGISELGPTYSSGNGLWIMEVDQVQAQNPRQLVAQDHIKNIAWSADGTKLAFEVRPPDIAASIVVVDAQGGRQISHFPGAQPAWSPDSQKLVIRTCAPDCGLWLVNFDGSGLKQLTFDSTDSYPAWSPTGQYLAFASQQRDGNWEVYRLQLADNQVIRLTDRAATDTTPVFGPCGQDIYLRTDYYNSWGITAIKLDGSDERQIKEDIGPSDDWGLARPAIR